MGAKVLILSQRRIADLVAYCLAYEFEDTIAAVSEAERIDVVDRTRLEFSRRAYKLARMTTRSPLVARWVAPRPSKGISLDCDYDLFFPMFSHVYELYALATLPDWRRRCSKACCFITEAWSEMLPVYLVELMAEFDHIFLGGRNAVDNVARLTGRPCSYLPLAVDVLRFAPVAGSGSRPIAVCNIGRRSQITHEALLAESARRQTFYYYDTVAASGTDRKDRTFRVDNPGEHRRMLACLLKHSRYFFANRSYVNRPEFTAGREEVSSRYYEGAAAGTVMIGEAPLSDDFKRQFDWPDAVIHVPFDCSDIGRVLTDLDGEPERLAAVRRANVVEAARRHDWLHRIKVVFDVFGLTPTEAMHAREKKLEAIAAQVRAT